MAKDLERERRPGETTEMFNYDSKGEYAKVVDDGEINEEVENEEEAIEEIVELDAEARETKRSFGEWISSFTHTKNGIFKLVALALIVVAALGFTIAAITGAFSGKKEPGPEDSSAGSSEVSEISSESSEFVSVTEVVRKEEEYTSVILEETPNAGDNYIQDTLFIGDSNTVRLSYFGIVPSNSSAGIVGIGIKEISTIKGVFFYDLAESPTTVMRAVELMQPRRIIINFGTNDVYRNNVKDFIDAYREAIAQLKKTYKYADIIIDAIHPVAASGEYSTYVKQSVIDEYNEALIDLADELGLHYLDSDEALKGSNGYAKAGYVDSDGIHLTSDGMKAYIDYVKTHSHIVEDTRPAVTNVPRKKEVDYVPGGLSGPGKKASLADKGTILDTVNAGLKNAGYKFDAGSEDLSDSSKWKATDYQVNIAQSDYKKGNETEIANTILAAMSGKKADYVKTSIADVLNDKGEVVGGVFTMRAYTEVEAQKYKITISANPSDGGTVTLGKKEAIEKDVVSISAKASSGYKFSEWQVTGAKATDPKSVNTTITVEKQDVTIVAVFVKDEHVHKLEKHAAVAPTCSKEGTAEYWQCTTCNKMFSDSEGKNQISKPQSIPKTGEHNWGEWQEVSKPSCAKEGKRIRKCQNKGCTATEEEAIPATGHKWGEWQVKTKPTCKPGVQERTCSVCGEKDTQEIAATGSHTWGDWQVVTPPSCVPGVQKRTCSVCGAEDTQEITATSPHSWGSWQRDSNPTCTEAGQEHRTCSVCGATETQPVDPLGHSWSSWQRDSNPTCTEAGQEHRTCSVCGATETQPVNPLGHSWGDWVTITEPTETTTGLQQRTCSICGATESNTLPATGGGEG